jgi:Fur family ferric uptake transcriptional regulator
MASGLKATTAREDSAASPNLEHFRALLQEHMVKRGLRSTDQRRLIVETFFAAPNHVSIEELLAQV